MKKFCIFILALIFLFSSFNVSARAMTEGKVINEETGIQEQNIPDALNPIKEKERLIEYVAKNKDIVYEHNNEKLIKLSVKEPIILEFDDGSRIEYHLTIHENPTNILNFTSKTFATTTSTKTYEVTKWYYYVAGWATVTLYADCTHEGRWVIMNRVYDGFSGGFSELVSHGTAIIKEKGFNSTCAIGEGWGEIRYQITQVGQWAYQTYRLQIWVDPAGTAYLKELTP
ncbi:MAG: hypothetical protein PWR01_633 [Clostridiales bacterium]|nr:hypothetical protein [Clostridiales bacterium]